MCCSLIWEFYARCFVNHAASWLFWYKKYVILLLKGTFSMNPDLIAFLPPSNNDKLFETGRVFWQSITICTCLGFFTLPQTLAAVSVRAPVLDWIGFCFQHRWLLLGFPVLIIYIWYFWIFHKLLWLTWKRIGEENVISLLSDINVILLSRWFWDRSMYTCFSNEFFPL